MCILPPNFFFFLELRKIDWIDVHLNQEVDHFCEFCIIQDLNVKKTYFVYLKVRLF